MTKQDVNAPLSVIKCTLLICITRANMLIDLPLLTLFYAPSINWIRVRYHASSIDSVPVGDIIFSNQVYRFVVLELKGISYP